LKSGAVKLKFPFFPEKVGSEGSCIYFTLLEAYAAISPSDFAIESPLALLINSCANISSGNRRYEWMWLSINRDQEL